MSVSPASSSGRFTHVIVLAITVIVYGGAVAGMTLQLRAGLLEQILKREAEHLTATASMQLDEANTDAPGALFVAVLKVQRLAGVSGLRLYDENRQPSDTWMLPRSEKPPSNEIWNRMEAGQPIGRLHTQLSPEESADLFLTSPSEAAVEAWVPLRRSGSSTLIGAAQFWLEGETLTENLAGHDRRLWKQALILWLAGSIVIGLALGWAFRRLKVANESLRMRSEDLLRANRELVLAAKTSALGAVTAHLMHEIKNPLAGLEMFVAGQSEAGRPEAGGELAAASELTRRLRTMVNDVTGVLRDEQTGTDFELTCAEIVDVVVNKIQPDARDRGVNVVSEGKSGAPLSGRRANLVMLVLRNLLQNALEATPHGGTVKLTGRPAAEGVEFLVEDGGAGLPNTVRERLFQPCVSTKIGGSGLGLAISYQIAQQAGGKLELVRSDSGGTCFRLVLRPEA
jgi:signal transduction histidine kinase